MIVIILVVLLIVLALLLSTRRTYTGGKSSILKLSWINPCYPKEMINACQQFIQNMSFSFDPEDSQKFTNEAAKLSKKYNIQIDENQLISIRNMEIALKPYGLKALKYGAEILTDARNGLSVLTISKKYHIPPMSVLKQILIEMNNSESDIRMMISNPEQLPDFLASQANDIFNADLGSKVNSEKIRKASADYEVRLGNYLKSLGIHFQTENELRKLNLQLTPDYLLTEPITINGKKINWIDAKDYLMYESRLVAKSILRQSEKYTKAFGPGAMIFSKGVMCGAKIHNTLLLDGSAV
jgi:hypothetical protein